MIEASTGHLVVLTFGLLLARVLPPRLVIEGAAKCGRLASRFSPARSVVAQNLTLISQAASQQPGNGRSTPPNARAEPADVFESYGRYWGELLALSAHPSLIDRMKIRVEGVEHLRAAVSRGPVCMLTGHVGNWDLGARWAATHLPGMAVVAEPLKPPALFRLFTRLRESGGNPVIPAAGAGIRLFRHIRGGGHLAMVVDRSFGAGTRPAVLLNGWRHFPASGMDLALRAGASLVPAFLLREEGGYAITVHPPLGKQDDPVQAFAHILEAEILRRPSQWCVLYPLHELQGLSSRES